MLLGKRVQHDVVDPDRRLVGLVVSDVVVGHACPLARMAARAML